MEVEIEDTVPFIVGENNQVIKVKKELLPYFKTLENLVKDAQSDYETVGIPLTTPGLTPDLMNLMIHFYEIYREFGIEGVKAAIQDDTFNEVFYREWVFLRNDIYDMAELAAIANQLDARDLLVTLLDEIYAEIYVLSPSQLQRRFDAIIKRKRSIDEEGVGEEEKDVDKRPMRFQYKREVQIQAVLASLLTYELVRGIDERITKYIPRLVGGDYFTFIRDKDGSQPPLIIRDRHLDSYFANTGPSTLAMTKGSRTLYQSNPEVSCGNIFYALLDQQGILSTYGEITKTPRDPFQESNLLSEKKPSEGVSLQENLFPDASIAMWSRDTLLIVLRHDALYAIGTWRGLDRGPGGGGVTVANQPLRIPNLEASSIIDVVCGPSHTFFLTRDGLYGCGDNTKKVLGAETVDPITYVPFLIDIEGQKIEKICASGEHSVALTDKGVLYACGTDHGQLGFGFGGNMRGHLWTKMEMPEDMARPELITCSEYRTVILAGNKLYNIGGQINQRSSPVLTKIYFWRDVGIIKDVLTTDSYILVLATKGLFLVTYGSASTVDEEIDAFGGRHPIYSTDNKLNFDIIDDEEKEASISINPNKRPKFSCLCSAQAFYVDKAKTGIFCSSYCVHKSLCTF